MITKTFKTKKVLNNFDFFLYSVEGAGAVVGENLTPIGEYSSTVKNRRKCARYIYRHVVVKGICSNN
jgi:hypothetical protein